MLVWTACVMRDAVQVDLWKDLALRDRHVSSRLEGIHRHDAPPPPQALPDAEGAIDMELVEERVGDDDRESEIRPPASATVALIPRVGLDPALLAFPPHRHPAVGEQRDL